MPLKLPKNGEDPHQTYSKTRFFIEMGMALAISAMFVLLLGVLRAPASIPIFYLTYRKNPRVAMFTAVILGLLMLVIKPVIIHPVNFIESPLEYMCIALAGYFPMGDRKFASKITQWFYDNRGVVIGTTLRFLVTLIGSYIIWSYYLRSSGPVIWLIALLDEGPIFIPYLVFSMVLIPYLVRYKIDIKELK